MRPEQQATIPVNPHMHLVINANNNFKHFNCCYHDADDMCKFYAIFMKKLIRALYEAFVTVVERKGCHDDETEMVPWQHSGSGNSI